MDCGHTLTASDLDEALLDEYDVIFVEPDYPIPKVVFDIARETCTLIVVPFTMGSWDNSTYWFEYSPHEGQELAPTYYCSLGGRPTLISTCDAAHPPSPSLEYKAWDEVPFQEIPIFDRDIISSKFVRER